MFEGQHYQTKNWPSYDKRIAELYRYRELLYMIVYRDIKVRYKQSIMRFLWAILVPLL